MRSDPPGSSGAGADVAVGSHEGEYDQVALRPLGAVDRAHHDALAQPSRIEGASHTAHLWRVEGRPTLIPALTLAPTLIPALNHTLTPTVTLTFTLTLTLTLTLGASSRATAPSPSP